MAEINFERIFLYTVKNYTPPQLMVASSVTKTTFVQMDTRIFFEAFRTMQADLRHAAAI